MAATDVTPNILGAALPRFRKDVPSTGKVATGYKPGSGRFGLYADPGPPNPGSHRGIAGGRVTVKCVHGDIHKYSLDIRENAQTEDCG